MTRFLALLLIFLGSISPVLATEYTFGIVPQQSSTKLAQLWTPILQKLSQQTGMDIRFATAKDIPTFEQRLAAGEYDFAYMNPYHFTVFNEAPGYVAMAHQSDKRIKGIVVVRKDSDIRELTDLDGQTLAFPSPAAFAATILPIANMEKIGMSIEPRYVSSHDSVYMAVSRGLLPAGGGIVRTFNNTDPAIKASLRILWTSAGYTPHAFAAHPDVAITEREKLTRALVDFANTEDGARLLADMGFAGIQLAEDNSWNDVRDLGIRKLESHNDKLAEQDQ
ncbi:PhnD/SsuA/transferrin family substrate-binding protein [Granulosicoccus sp. 3-233]|uniref:PhnD/SsuA/transferrin family substrate-binding protein n=1 Tax=Granulosicoccus sp. 3-233 TaxID=3417969 RepID=UPI003D337F48